MTTEKQILANQQNAKRSTGPRTESGKRRSRRNAVRHGLTAETVIDNLEDAADYSAFERAIKCEYGKQTAIEGQLVSRLASLLWRLRRAVIVESGLLNIQAEKIGDHGARSRPTKEQDLDRLSIFHKFLRPHDLETRSGQEQEASGDVRVNSNGSVGAETNQRNTNIARSFLQLISVENQGFERLGGYEKNLWRQTAQTLLLLSSIELGSKGSFPDERPCFGRVRRKHGRYPPFDFNPFLRSGGRWR